MLGNLTKKLTSLRSEREALERLIAEEDAPRKRLAELQAQERELAEHQAALEAERARLEAEVQEIAENIALLERFEARLLATRDVLDEIENCAPALYTLPGVPLRSEDVNRVLYALRQTYGQAEDRKRLYPLDYQEGTLAFLRAKVARLQARIKDIDKELGKGK